MDWIYIFVFLVIMTPIVLLLFGILMIGSVIKFTKRKLIPWLVSFNVKKTVLTFVAIGFLFEATTDDLPYGYFTLERFVVCAACIYLAYIAYENNKHSLWVWAFGFISILFNPLIPIVLEKEQWVPIDYVVGIFLLASIVFFRNKRYSKKVMESDSQKLNTQEVHDVSGASLESKRTAPTRDEILDSFKTPEFAERVVDFLKMTGQIKTNEN